MHFFCSEFSRSLGLFVSFDELVRLHTFYVRFWRCVGLVFLSALTILDILADFKLLQLTSQRGSFRCFLAFIYWRSRKWLTLLEAQVFINLRVIEIGNDFSDFYFEAPFFVVQKIPINRELFAGYKYF